MQVLVLAALLLAPLPVRGWVSASEMTRAQYRLVGRYMVRHFERAEDMLTALQGEKDNAVRPRQPTSPSHVSCACVFQAGYS
jgi:hypothetical protein